MDISRGAIAHKYTGMLAVGDGVGLKGGVAVFALKNDPTGSALGDGVVDEGRGSLVAEYPRLATLENVVALDAESTSGAAATHQYTRSTTNDSVP